MKTKLTSLLMLVVMILLMVIQPAFAQGSGGDPSTAAPAASESPPASSGGERPVLVVNSYSVTDGKVEPGTRFILTMNLCNQSPSVGKLPDDLPRFARNAILNYSGDDFLPDTTGGLRAAIEMDPQECINIEQPFFASNTLWSSQFGKVQVSVNYTDVTGQNAYTGLFNITIPIKGWGSGSGSGVAAPTKTPTQVARPQLVISSYATDIDPLQPGTRFQLKVSVSNVGSALARGVTMILGGGNAQDLATPGAGASSTGDFSTFTPLGSSNIVVMGDIEPGGTVQKEIPLVVNVTAAPGSYPLKMTFAYDIGGQMQASDQFISLQIYQLPLVDITFGQPVMGVMTGNPVQLSLQVNNLGKKSTVLGMIHAKSDSGTFMPESAMVGSMDPGGYFSFDTQFTPMTAGKADLNLIITYLDDFNQTRSIEKTLSIDVTDMPTPEPLPMNPDGTPINPQMPQEQTVWQKIGAFFRGLFGLDSSSNTPQPGMSEPGMPDPAAGGKGG